MRFEVMRGDPTTIHRDKRIPLKVRGLFTLILSMPRHWNFTIEGLSIMTPEVDNRVAIKACLKVLIQFGYAKRVKFKNKATGEYVGKAIRFYESGNQHRDMPREVIHPQHLPGLDPRPTKRTRKASPNVPISSEHRDSFYRLCYRAETALEQSLLSSTQRGRIASMMGQLRESGADLNDIMWFEQWWNNDWRSRDKDTKQKQAPRPEQVTEHWWVAIKSTKPLIPVPVVDNTPKITSNIIDFQKMHEIMAQKAGRKQ